MRQGLRHLDRFTRNFRGRPCLYARPCMPCADLLPVYGRIRTRVFG